MNDLVKIGNKIKEKRLSLNLRMDDLAKKCEITRATLSLIEQGKANCSVETVFKLMNALGLSFELNDKEISIKTRQRASRINSSLDKKINRFVIMCVEQYALNSKNSSHQTYIEMKNKGIIENLSNDYEDLHGMSLEYLNHYIEMLLMD